MRAALLLAFGGSIFISPIEADTGKEIAAFLVEMDVAPIVVRENAVLESDRITADQAWEERVLVSEFRRRMEGRNNEDEAIAATKAFLRQTYGPPSLAIDFEEPVQQGEVLWNKGLFDPYFLSRFAESLDKTRQNEWDAAFYLKRALQGLPKTEYSPALECRIKLRLIQMQNSGPFKLESHPAERLAKEAADAFLRSIEKGDYHDDETWLALAHFRSLFHDNLKKENHDVRDRIVNNAALPLWARNTMRGMTAISRAWNDRGAGFADSVTEEGWKGFRENIAIARSALEASWQENPEDPLAAALMIRVVMAEGPGPDESLRLWFDRAIAAQFDCPEAYEAILWAYRPRWCGSHELMKAFGLACWQTNRYDTLVPFQLERAMRGIAEEITDWREAYDDPLVREALPSMALSYLSAPTYERQEPLWRGKLATWQWRCAHYEEGLATLEKAGDLYHRLKYQLDDVGTDVNQLRGEMELGAKGLLEKLLAADQCFAQEEFDEAESAYQELRDQCDAYAVPWLESKLALIQFERSMVKGEWTPIKFDPILGLWDQRTGEWEADKEGRLVAQGRKGRGWWRIVHRGSVGADFEMRTKVRFESHDPFAFRLGPVVGCRFQLDRFGRPKPEKADWISCVWSRNKKGKSSTLLLNRYHLGNLRPQPIQVPATEITELKVHAVDGKITFYINGVPVITDQALTPLNKEKPIKLLSGDGVGFFIHFMATDPKVIFEDAEVRRL